ncbi:Uncharacterised protein [uncultured archaeon]|nr:Uncharacterised protein [uncultured archaeon]
MIYRGNIKNLMNPYKTKNKPQIKAPRVTPLSGVSTSTVAPVDVAHTYGSPPYVDIAARYAPQGIRVRGVENPQGFGNDERRFNASDSRLLAVI